MRLTHVYILILFATLCVADQVPLMTQFVRYNEEYFHAHLYFRDSNSNGWNFACNHQGVRVTDEVAYNHGSDIRQWFNGTHDLFEVGIQGGERGRIIDLGVDDDLNRKYPSFDRTLNIIKWEGIALRPSSELRNLKNPPQRLTNYLLTIKTEADRSDMESITKSTYYYMSTESETLLETNDKGTKFAAVIPDHIYLVSIFDNNKLVYLGKFKVLDFVPRIRAVLSFENLYVDNSNGSNGRQCINKEDTLLNTGLLIMVAVIGGLILLLLSVFIIFFVMSKVRAPRYQPLQ